MVNIGKYDERYLLQRAEEIVVAKSEGSQIFDEDAEDAIPRFLPSGEYGSIKIVRCGVQFHPNVRKVCLVD